MALGGPLQAAQLSCSTSSTGQSGFSIALSHDACAVKVAASGVAAIVAANAAADSSCGGDCLWACGCLGCGAAAVKRGASMTTGLSRLRVAVPNFEGGKM